MSLVQIDDFILWVTLGIILGGRTGYVLFYNLPFFIEHPAAIFKLWEGGMSFHGGFLGCVVAVMWFAYRNSISILSLGDITTAVAPVGLLLGRIANFINGELWGRATDPELPWAMIFPNPPQLPRHPSQLYEAGMEGILLLTVLAIMIRFGALKRPGMILGAFILIYGLSRIAGEHFREPDAQLGFLWGGLTMGMLLSIPMLIVGALLIVLAVRRGAPKPTRLSVNSFEKINRDRTAATQRDQGADQIVRTDAGLAVHGPVPDASALWLLRLARSARDAKATSSPRPKSARCSANCWACGPPRSGRRWARRNSCG